MEYGAKTDAESKAGFTPLHLAAFTGDVDKASIILEQIGRQEVDCPGFGEVTALHVAVMKVRIILSTYLSLVSKCATCDRAACPW